nr:hypothetical protein [Candidatus Sigynarchaeota archaeon]
GIPEVATFTGTARKAHEIIMNEIYSKIIRSASQSYLHDGTVARCPKCASKNVRELGGAYEFTEMECKDCGYRTYVDDWELEEWYPEPHE